MNNLSMALKTYWDVGAEEGETVYRGFTMQSVCGDTSKRGIYFKHREGTPLAYAVFR